MSTGFGVEAGVIDVAWYQTEDGNPSSDSSVWTPHFAQVRGADTKSPKVTEQAVTTLPNHKGGICLQGILCGVGPGSADRSLADFFQLRVNPLTKKALIAYSDNSRLGPGKGQVVIAAQTVDPAAVVAAPAPTATPAMPNTTATSAPPVPLGPAVGLTGAGAVLGLAVMGRRLRRRRQ
jgi:hypothetical protein